MNTTTAPFEGQLQIPAHWPAIARQVLPLLHQLRHGAITIQWPDDQIHTFGDPEGRLHAHLHLRSWEPIRQAMRSGDIGFAESYLAGEWSSADLTTLLRLFIANRRALDDLIFGHWMGRLYYRIRHWMNRNHRANSRRNIHAHYDLGNAFYRLWLDESMNYSSAWFNGDYKQNLREAQMAKMRRALQMVRVLPGDRVLEIGCGWGAVAELGGREFGTHMTGVTLSTEQLAFAQQRLRDHGLHHNSDLRLQDYRDIQDGPYDAICSIEMIEAVGEAYWPTYFETVARLLRPGGRACIQSIVIDDALFARYRQSTDFIQQYIFPGGCLPCPTEFRTQAQLAGLKVVDEFAFGPDYAETLRRWRSDFHAQRQDVLALGFDDQFLRLWEFYLCYCEAAFDEGSIDVVQYTLQKQ